MLLDFILKRITATTEKLKRKCWKTEVENTKFERDFPTIKRMTDEKKAANKD